LLAHQPLSIYSYIYDIIIINSIICVHPDNIKIIMEERRKLLNVRVRISYIYPDLRRGRRRRRRSSR
jgi:hypothetical protein